jgi:hypothetical protein
MKASVFGSGLDSLVCCYQLLNQGYEVEHFTGGNRLAGHFAGASTEHGSFDLGMVLLEKDMRTSPQENFTNYRNEFGIDARPYLKESFEFLEKNVGSIRPRKIATLLDSSREIKDYFIADSLDFLDELSSVEKSKLQVRLTSLISDDSSELIHPSLKNEIHENSNRELSYQLELTYGKDLTRKLFGQFLEALTGSESSTLPIKFHRKLWLPLYFPETILSRLVNSDKSLSELTFYEFSSGSMATKIAELINQLKRNNQYREDKSNYTDCNISEKSGTLGILLNASDAAKVLKSEVAQNTASKVSEQVFQTKPNQINILHLCTQQMDNKTVILQSPISKLFRFSISNGISDGISSLSAEFGNLSFDSINDLVEIIKEVLPNIQTKCDGQVFKLNFAARHLEMSPEDWRATSDYIRDEFATFSDNVFIIHPDALSFNDNLVRGLAAAEKIGL